jgi:dUTP pyrophosphatase
MQDKMTIFAKINKERMLVKIKKLSSAAVIPSYAQTGDAGLDLTAITVSDNANYIEYGTGLAVQIPEGYVGLLFARSSISKKNLILANGVGVIDSGYRGEIKLRFKKCSTSQSVVRDVFAVGEKVGQLIIIPYPSIELEEVEELSETIRDTGGFGSTGI